MSKVITIMDKNKYKIIKKDDIYRVLFNRIIEGSYKPGYRLTEEMFAIEFGTSRTPIREVFQQLSRTGLIKILPNKRVEVVGLTCDDLEEIYNLREILEVFVLEYAIYNIQLHELSILRAKTESININMDYSLVSAIDRNLHSYIAECSRRVRIREYLEPLLLLSIRYTSFPDPESIMRIKKEHLDLINALYQRDLQRAKKILREHIQNSKIFALNYLFHKNNL